MSLQYFIKLSLLSIIGSASFIVASPSLQAAESDVEITIEEDDNNIEPREKFDYIITVENPEERLTNQTISIIVDDELSIRDFTNGGTRSGDEVTWENVTLSANSDREYRVEVEVGRTADDGDKFRTKGYLNGSLKESITTTVDTDDDAELTITIEQDGNTVTAGENVRFDIILENDGRDDYENLEITASLDDDMSFLSATRRGDEISDDRVRWDEIDVDNRDTTVLTLNVRILQSVALRDVLTIDIEAEDEDGDRIEEESVQVTVGSTGTNASSSSSSTSSSSSSNQSTTSNSSSSSTNTVNVNVQTQRTRVVLEADRQETQPGSSINYTVVIQNNSNFPLENVALSANVDPLALPLSRSEYIVNGQTITWNPLTVNANSTLQKKFQVRAVGTASQGDTITTNITTNINGDISSKTQQVRVIQQLPVTGATERSSNLTLSNRVYQSQKSVVPFVIAIIILGMMYRWKKQLK